jgi:hypothetical protein
MLGRISDTGEAMAFEVGTAVLTQAGSTSKGPRAGTIEEVLRGEPSPRYRVRWEDGHESVLTPADGALKAAPRRRRPAPASGAMTKRPPAKGRAKAKGR